MIRQIVAISLLNLLTLPQRWVSSAVIVLGMACVMAVLLSFLAVSGGMLNLIENLARADLAVAVAKGAPQPNLSRIERGQALLLMDKPGVKKDVAGRPLATGQIGFGVQGARRDNGRNAFFGGAGRDGPTFAAMAPEYQVVEGRMFNPGMRELVVGRDLQQRFVGLEVGADVPMPDGKWRIVGATVNTRIGRSGELSGDADTLMATYATNAFNTVLLQLENEGAFETFSDAVAADPSLNVDVFRQKDFMRTQARQIFEIANALGYGLGGLIGLGVIFGVLNTMYAAVTARMAEIATLRAIGFNAVSAASSVLFEAVVLALVGAIAGGAAAWAIAAGNFLLQPSILIIPALRPEHMGIAVFAACLVGVLGGLPPAVRAARLPIAAALQIR